MAASDARLKPSQIRGWHEVMDLVQRAVPHLTRLRIAGVPLEQHEARVQHLIQAYEGVMEYEKTLTGATGE